MALTNAAKNEMLSALAAKAGTVSLHTADPGTTGASEAAGVTRRAIAFSAPNAGNLDSSNVPVFDVPGGTTITHWGLWSNDATPAFLAGNALSSPESYGADGTYSLDDLDFTL